MTKQWKLAAACLAALSAPSAFADAPPNYVTLMGSYILEDSSRAGDHGVGWHALYGSPLNQWLSLELSGFGTRLDRKGESVSDYQYGAGLDLLGLRGTPALSGFVLGGLGTVYENFPGTSELSPFVDVGAGFLLGLPIKNLKLRGEGRYYAIFNSKSYPGTDVLFDAHLNLGVQFAFGSLFEKTTKPVPAPAPVSLDDDGDGVPNDRDECPQTPPGTLVDGRGCPAAVPLAPTDADSDGDGVVDSLDRCPNTLKGLRVDADGCAVEAQSIVILKNVHFEFDKSDLTRDARLVLDNVVAGMKGQPAMQVELAGHTDSLGTETYNLGLSQRRADAVRTFLIDRGIDPARIHAEGYGEFQPIADNNTDEGRALNRRVEFKVIKQ